MPIFVDVVARSTRGGLLMLAAVLPLACSGQPVDQSPPPSPPPPPPPGEATVTVAIDTTVRYQMMTGWEAVAQAGQESPGFQGWQQHLMDLAANDLGINRLRLEIKAGVENPVDYYTRWRTGAIPESEFKAHRYTVVNDNADPNAADPTGFQWSQLDSTMLAVVLPLRERLQARGESLYLNLNYVAFGSGAGVHLAPAEYAELMLAAFQHFQSRWGFVPDAVEMILEPDNATPWRGPSIGAALAAAGARLAAAGFHPAFIAPSTTSMANAVPYADQIAAVAGASQYFTTISYHRYGGVSDANLGLIASRGVQGGLRTAMLEHIGSGAEDLYKDLTIANVSAWQQFTLAYPTTDNGAQYFVIREGQPVMGSRTPALRQYFRYVRLGAHRVKATSDNGAVRPVGFTNVGGGPVMVLHVSSPQVAAIRGIRPGSYSVTTSDPGHANLGTVTATTQGLQVTLPVSDAVVTVAWTP